MALQKFCDNRVMNGYDSMLLFKKSGEDKYHLLLPLETVPTVNNSSDTFDFDLLTCPSKGQVEGKESLDQVEVDFMWHRDNVLRLEELQGQVLDFMVVYKDYTARTFTGTIKVRPQEAGADVMRGTFTITPMSAQTTTILDARDLIQLTVAFASQIPSSVEVADGSYTIKNVKTDPTTANLTFASDNEHFTASKSGQDITIQYTGEGATKEYAIITITASVDNYASWTTTIAVENKVNA
ncbi:MAG: hypothetical protein IJ371_01890 [Clostridia bacterium]|nr:hypothetical protein [Clostridia bacterium]